jgi:hypothetical protein
MYDTVGNFWDAAPAELHFLNAPKTELRRRIRERGCPDREMPADEILGKLPSI